MEKYFSNAERAQILTQALPYIRRYNGKIVVIKYGGNAMINAMLKHQVMEDIVLLSLIGVKVVLVHGGGPEISETMQRLGKKAEFVDGLRVTDRETVDIVQMVLAGKINKTLVNLLQMNGGKAMGISGMDGRLIEAKIKDERLGYVGDVVHVNIEPVTDLLEKGYIPVISTIGCDRDGNTYNINGDTAAAHIAGALGAKLSHGKEPEIGFAPIKRVDKHDYFSMWGKELNVLHWHNDVVGLPEGAQLLARSANTKNQAFRAGSALGLQFHLEVTATLLDEWLAEPAMVEGMKKSQIAKIRDDFAEYDPQLQPLADQVFSGFAARCNTYIRTLHGR